MYAKGVTELLMIEADDLKVLLYNRYNLPRDFVNTVDILRTYPVQKLLDQHRDSMTYKYFP